jgi:hypothetical protein
LKKQKKLADHDIFLTALASLVLGLKLEHKDSIATADLSFFLLVLDCAAFITLEELLRAERELLLDLNFRLLSSTTLDECFSLLQIKIEAAKNSSTSP